MRNNILNVVFYQEMMTKENLQDSRYMATVEDYENEASRLKIIFSK